MTFFDKWQFFLFTCFTIAMITPVQIYNINSVNTFASHKFVQPMFTGMNDSWNGAGSITRDSRERLDYVVDAYNNILKSVDKKTTEGREEIERESGCVIETNSFLFKNINPQRESLLVKIPQGNRDGNCIKFILSDKDKNVKDAILLAHKSYPVKNFDIQYPKVLPKEMQFYTKQELQKSDLPARLESFLDIVDYRLLQLRKLVEAKQGQGIKIKKLPDVYMQNLNHFQELDKKLYEFYETVPHTRATKLRTSYDNFVPGNTAHSYTFKNIGVEKNTITLARVNSAQYGEVFRLMVSAPNGELKNAYLIKDRNIFANFNPQYIAIFPSKPVFVDAEQFEDGKYTYALRSYLEDFAKEMDKFHEHVTRVRDEKPVGFFSEHERENLLQLKKSYDYVVQELGALFPSESFDIKQGYGQLELIAGKRGYTFTNIDDENKKLTVYKLATKKHHDLLKLTITDTLENEKVFLLDGNKLVKNYNPQYTVIPENLTYYNEDELNNIDIPIVMANEKLFDLKNYVQGAVKALEEQKQSNRLLREQMKAERLAHKAKTNITKEHSPKKTVSREYSPRKTSGRPKRVLTEKEMFQKEYGLLTSRYSKEFKQALENAPQDLNAFNVFMEALKENVNKIVSAMQNVNDQE